MQSEPLSNVPFKNLVLNSETPEEIDKKADQLKAAAQALRDKQKASEDARLSQERDGDMKKLFATREELRKLENVTKLSGKLDLDQALKLTEKRDELLSEIEAIETKYGIAQPTQAAEELPVKMVAQTTVWPTVAKIVGLLLFCWGIVLYSGDWILEKYPNAAIYNDVSFQKVLFAFSVFIAGISTVIVSLTVFFPGFGKYFNPFNRDNLDFYNDFKSLSEWQRNIISIVLFSILLLAFVLIVGGKLD